MQKVTSFIKLELQIQNTVKNNNNFTFVYFLLHVYFNGKIIGTYFSEEFGSLENHEFQPLDETREHVREVLLLLYTQIQLLVLHLLLNFEVPESLIYK